MYTQLISQQVLILAILALTGFIAYKVRVIQKREQESISKIVFNITLPILIILKIGNIELSTEILFNSGFTLLFAFVAVLGFYWGGRLTGKIFRLKSITTIHSLHMAFGNTVFLGFPLLDAVFPNTDVLLYASMFMLVSNSLVWTFGVYQLNKSKKNESDSIIKSLLNPNTIAFFIGFIVMLVPVEIPELVNSTFSGIAAATFPLSMIYIGSMLATIRFKKIVRHWHVFLLSFNKLLFFPFLLTLLLFAFFQLTGWEVGLIPKMVVVLEAAMPCQVIVVILAEKYRHNPRLATEQFFVATIFSAVTIPAVYYLAMHFLQ